MQRTGVRRALFALVLGVPLPLAGCATLGLGGTGGSATPLPSPSGGNWVIVAPGKATPSATVRHVVTSPTPLVGLSLRPGGAACTPLPVGTVLIPVTVTAGKGALTVTWSRVGPGATYRIAAVPQDLVSGSQPPVAWQSVTAASGCTGTGTITGLRSGRPYIVWLDAPGSGTMRDGTRNPYSGRSRVVYPG